MVKPSVDAPLRWAEGSQAGEDARLTELFRAVEAPAPLPAAALRRVRERLGADRSMSRSARRLRELVMATSMLLFGSSLALAGWGASEWLSGRSQSTRQPASETAPRRVVPTPSAQHLRPSSAHADVPLTSPEATTSFVHEDDTRPKPSAPKAKAEPRALPPPADSGALAAESRALERALIKLRREHDPRGALSVLDESRALFEKGALAQEAQVARVDALLALGRRSEALAILERLPLTHMGRGGELQLVRAELRAGNDCALALADFDALATRPLAAPFMERVLYGRAACELQVGDRSQAERDLNQYLTRFPHGRFAARVDEQLAKLRDKTD